MVSRAPSQLRETASRLFEQDELPPEFEWANSLSPKHARQFAVELSDALKASKKDGGQALQEVFDAWKATAAVDADPPLRKRLLAGRDKKKTYTAWQPTKPTR